MWLSAAIKMRIGPLAILLHGFPEFWGSWRHQISALVDLGYRVWVPDLRGYNTSDAPQKVSEYRMSNIGADVRDLILAANVDSCALMGHDWGAAIAWWVAAEYPEHVDKLIIANVPHPRVFRRHVFTSPRQCVEAGTYSFSIAVVALSGCCRERTFLYLGWGCLIRH